MQPVSPFTGQVLMHGSLALPKPLNLAAETMEWLVWTPPRLLFH